jgi:hypothetical protein
MHPPSDQLLVLVPTTGRSEPVTVTPAPSFRRRRSPRRPSIRPFPHRRTLYISPDLVVQCVIVVAYPSSPGAFVISLIVNNIHQVRLLQHHFCVFMMYGVDSVQKWRPPVMDIGTLSHYPSKACFLLHPVPMSLNSSRPRQRLINTSLYHRAAIEYLLGSISS